LILSSSSVQIDEKTSKQSTKKRLFSAAFDAQYFMHHVLPENQLENWENAVASPVDYWERRKINIGSNLDFGRIMLVNRPHSSGSKGKSQLTPHAPTAISFFSADRQP
jgi:hypothetical protein